MSKIKSVLNVLAIISLLVASAETYANDCNGLTPNALDSSANDVTNTNTTSISTTANSSCGIASSGENTTNINSGSITTSGNVAHGIMVFNNNPLVTVINSGTISTTGNYSAGVVLAASNSTVTNSGRISTVGLEAFGIISSGENVIIKNSGAISTSNNNSAGISSWGDNATIINSGKITTLGDDNPITISADGIASYSTNATITNDGVIHTSGPNAYGVRSYGSHMTLTNDGTIWASGLNSHGIYLTGESSVVTNSGSIKATDSGAKAIYLASEAMGTANQSIVNLLKGSVIVGDIYADSNVTGAKLNINLGSGASYAYSVTGPWAITDLDNRPMVTGSAFAAGIGAQETAAQMLYQRTSSITSALDRRLRSYASDEVDNQPYWLDVYYSDVSRNSGGNYSTRNAFSNYNYGMTAGFKLPIEMTPIELVVNVEQSNLNIDSGNQKIDSTSIMAGVVAPDLTDVLGAKLSAKALLGFANNDGDRKVMTNSLLYDGSRQIKSDYNSTYAVFGAALTKLYPITDHLTADTLVGLDLVTEHINAYAETDYFAWQGRTLNQLQSRVQAGIDYKLFENKVDVFARVGVERRDLISGDTQNYSINDAGTIINVSFKSNNSNDNYATAQLGFKAQLEKRIQLFGVVNGLHSSDTVSSIQGNIGLRADF